MKSGNLNFLEPSGPLQACNGTGLPLSTFPYYYRYHFLFHIPHALNFYCKVFIFQSLLSFIIIIIIITIIIISFMQGIYTYIPETNYVPSVYSVAVLCTAR